MSLLNTKAGIEQFFITNWTQTSIQFEGVPFDYSSLTKFISLKFSPISNDQYAYDGSSTGRVNYTGQMQVFCYAQNSPLAYKLADDVIAFLSGKDIGTIEIGYGQAEGSAIKLDSGHFEMMVTFRVENRV